MQTVIWTLFGAALGAGCGCGALYWAYQMLANRGREERLLRNVERILVIGAVICGGVIGGCTGGWLPAVFALALLTVSIAVAVPDWLCRVIPNPTVLALFALKIPFAAAAWLSGAGLTLMDVLSSLGGMVFCFLLFCAPGLLGKQVGAGDIKLAAAMGFLLGFNTALVAIVFMGLLVIGYSLVQRNMPLLVFLKTDIPMGPFIAAGMMIAYLLPYLPL